MKLRQFLSNLINGNPIAQTIVDGKSHVLECNSAFEELFHYRREELEGRPLYSLVVPPELQQEAARLVDSLQNGGVKRVHTVRWRKDQQRIDVEFSAVPFLEKGKVVAAFLQYLDVTRTIESERALRESEERYRQLVENINDILFSLDEKGRITYMSPVMEQLSGFAVSEVLGKAFSEFVHAEDVEELRASFGETLSGRLRPFEFRVRTREGKLRWVRSSSRPVYQNNRVSGVHGLITDISRQKQAEEALQFTQFAVDHAADATFWLESDGRIVYVNESACRSLNYSRDELLHMSIEDVNQDAAGEAGARRWSLLDHQSSISFEGFNRRKNGELFPVDVVANRIEFSGKTYICANVRDASDRKLLEEQLHRSQRMEAIGRLAGGVAHDFNNLLTVIRGFCELLLEELSPTSTAFQNAQEIDRAAARAADLTHHLLAFSRRQVLRPRVIDLNEIVHEMRTMLERLLGKEVRLIVNLDPELGSVQADPVQMEQVLLNLAVNSRDAMPKGGEFIIETSNVTLDQEWSRRHAHVRSGPHVLLSVRDTGVGMNEETLAQAFEPFFTTKEMGRGTGLGLSTVYGIVKQSGGSVWAHSEPGKGTLFQIYLPRLTEDCAERHLGQAAGSEETILVVEDAPAVRKLVVRFLRLRGYRVLEATDPVEALETAKHHDGNIDLLLTDVIMPQMSGGEIARRFLQLRPSAKVVFISGYSDASMSRQELLQTGGSFLEKPLTMEVLNQKVREVLDS